MIRIDELIKCLGGTGNILSVTSCMTRLRITVADDGKTDSAALEKLEDVLGIVHDRKNYLEIVVGPGKCKKYADELKAMGIGASGVMPIEKSRLKPKELLKILGDIFVPLIPGVIAAGLCAGFASMEKQLCPGYEDSAVLNILYNFLTLISTSFMTYMSAWAGYRAAERFGATPIIGGMLGMISTLDGINQIAQVFGLYNKDVPLSSVLCSGKGGILAVIFGVYLLSVIEKKIRSKVPDSLNMILTPLLSLACCLVLYIGIIMPVFGFISSGIETVVGDLCLSRNVLVRAVTGYICAALFLPLVATGMHHGLIALYTVQLQELGYVTLYPALAMAGAGQVGAAVSIIRKAKKAGNERLRHVAAGALPAGLLGIGEPLVYGVTLPLGKPFITAGLGAGLGGALVMIMEVGATTWGPSGLLGVFIMTAGPNGFLTNAAVYLLSLVIAAAGGYLVTEFAFSEKELEEKSARETAHNKNSGEERRYVNHGDDITFDLMKEGFSHRVKDPFGIHARPASKLCALVKKYDAVVTIAAGEKKAVCGGISDIMSLGAVQGTQLFVSAKGKQSREALSALKSFMDEEI